MGEPFAFYFPKGQWRSPLAWRYADLMKNSQNICVAVVDDDESLCRSLSRFLRAARLLPITYPSAEAFLADTEHPQFDCLLLDVQLDGMSGLDLSRRLAALKDLTPIVFITALDDPSVRVQAEASGCAGFLRKTDSGEEVLAAICRAIGLENSDAADPHRENPQPPNAGQTNG